MVSPNPATRNDLGQRFLSVAVASRAPRSPLPCAGEMRLLCQKRFPIFRQLMPAPSADARVWAALA